MAKTGRDAQGRFLPGFTTCPGGNPASLLPPGEANFAHGLTRWLGRALAPPCRRCIVKNSCAAFEDGATCRLAEAERAGVAAMVMALPHIEPTDKPLVDEYSQLAVALRIADLYLSEVGPFTVEGDELKLEPVLRLRTSLSNSMRLMASELGLTPTARARLKVSEKSPLIAAFAELAALEEGDKRDD